MAMNYIKADNNDIYDIPEEKLADIADIMPDMEETLDKRLDCFLQKTNQNPFVHMNEGYLVVVRTTNEIDATEAISNYLRKRMEMI